MGLQFWMLCLIFICQSYWSAGVSGASSSDDCAAIRTYGSYNPTQVATCDAAKGLAQDIEDLESDVSEYAESVDIALGDLNDTASQLVNDVSILKGETSIAFQIEAVLDMFPGDRRVLCEIYTLVEAAEICRILGFEFPDPYFIHKPCDRLDEADCPTKFWKIRQSCFRSNDVGTDPLSSLFDCFYDPLPLGETCRRVMYIGCTGFTTNFMRFPVTMDMSGGSNETTSSMP